MSSIGVGIRIWDAGSVKTNPTAARASRGKATGSMLLTRTTPDCGTTRALNKRSSVDLPEPLSPITAVRGSLNSQLTRSSTVNGPAGESTVRLTLAQYSDPGDAGGTRGS